MKSSIIQLIKVSFSLIIYLLGAHLAQATSETESKEKKPIKGLLQV